MKGEVKGDEKCAGSSKLKKNAFTKKKLRVLN